MRHAPDILTIYLVLIINVLSVNLLRSVNVLLYGLEV